MRILLFNINKQLVSFTYTWQFWVVLVSTLPDFSLRLSKSVVSYWCISLLIASIVSVTFRMHYFLGRLQHHLGWSYLLKIKNSTFSVGWRDMIVDVHMFGHTMVSIHCIRMTWTQHSLHFIIKGCQIKWSGIKSRHLWFTTAINFQISRLPS